MNLSEDLCFPKSSSCWLPQTLRSNAARACAACRHHLSAHTGVPATSTSKQPEAAAAALAAARLCAPEDGLDVSPHVQLRWHVAEQRALPHGVCFEPGQVRPQDEHHVGADAHYGADEQDLCVGALRVREGQKLMERGKEKGSGYTW